MVVAHLLGFGRLLPSDCGLRLRSVCCGSSTRAPAHRSREHTASRPTTARMVLLIALSQMKTLKTSVTAAAVLLNPKPAN